MKPVLAALVDRLLNRIEDQGKADLIDDFAAAIPVEIIGNLLGIPHADRGPLRGWSLARLERRIAIGRFLHRIPDYALSGWPQRGGRDRFRGFLHLPVAVR